MGDERGLHRVELVALGEALDGRDLGALGGDRQRQARVDGATVAQHRASATLAVIAALPGPGQRQVLAQRIEQRDPRIDLQSPVLPVDAQDDIDLGSCVGRGSCRRRRRSLGAALAASMEEDQAETGDQAHDRPVAAGDPGSRRQPQELAPGCLEGAGEARGQLAARRMGEADDRLPVDDEHAVLAGLYAPARAEIGELAAEPRRSPGRQLDIIVGPERPDTSVRDDEQDGAEPTKLRSDRAVIDAGRPAAHEREHPRPPASLRR